MTGLDWYQLPRPAAGPAPFDEAVDEHGDVRPAWAPLSRRLAGLGEHGLAERRRRCEHLLAAFGATHVPHRELLEPDAGALRPGGYHLDPIPFVVGHEEWRRLSAAIADRARVIAAIAADFAGPRALLERGVVPAAAVFGEPAFLPMAPPGAGAPMTWYGADLVRSADGRWRVLRDVTDELRGLGEALLHRSVVGRVLGDLGDRPGPAPLTDHLDALRAQLGRAAPAGRQSPRTVVLTPEAGSVEYVAVSHLTAQLGFHRTSAADLVVREHRVWLRSLGGLEQVDVVLRAVRAGELDPLVNPRSGRGVPGLVHAERSGDVAILNPVGAALAGSLSMAPHVIAAGRFLTGSAPVLEGVPSVWCGEPEAVAAVLADPDRWVVQDTATGEVVFGSSFAGSGDWPARLRLRPASFVALRKLDLATVPVVRGARAAPGAVVLGVSALVDGHDVQVMPGGFARVIDPDTPILGQHSGWAKDVWVYEPRRARATVVAGGLPQVDLRESLPTRAAEAMFWLGRAAEAAEVLVRTVRTVADRAATDGPAGAPGAPWAAVAVSLLRAARGMGTVAADVTVAEELGSAVTGRGGVRDQLDRMLVAAGSVREFLSTTTGRVLADVGDLRRSLRADDPESLERLLVALAAFAGLAQESTVRGPAWRMLDLGRRVERALAVLGAVEAALARPPDAESFQAVGETLLAAHEGLVAYRRWHRTDVELDALVDLLARDDANPRSVAFQIDRVIEHLASLPASSAERTLAADAASAVVEHAPPGPLVLAVRAPLLDLVDRLVHRWFADPVTSRRLG